MSSELQGTNHYKNNIRHHQVELELIDNAGESILGILICNTETRQEFKLAIDHYHIRRDAKLSTIFRTAEDIFKEIIGEF